jgi:hypothetical protein
MTCKEAYEEKKADLAKLAFLNTFLGLREAFEAGWECAMVEIERQNKTTTWRYYPK